jgi:hypothetical protein
MGEAESDGTSPISNEKDEDQRLGWRHYVALVIAVLQTTLFPLIAFVIVLVLLTIILSRHI